MKPSATRDSGAGYERTVLNAMPSAVLAVDRLLAIVFVNPAGEQLFGMSRSAIELHIDIPDDIPAVACSQSDLEQVFLNLLTNAREATPHGGRIAVTVRSTNHAVEIAIADTGCGIPREHLPRILEPFFTTKPHGNGLGLSICRSVLWEVDGTMTIQSEAGTGTRVDVRIPQAALQPHVQGS